jgi:hypothetical protein
MQYYSTVTDHYLYLPMLGVAIAVASLMSRHEGMALPLRGRGAGGFRGAEFY